MPWFMHKFILVLTVHAQSLRLSPYNMIRRFQAWSATVSLRTLLASLRKLIVELPTARHLNLSTTLFIQVFIDTERLSHSNGLIAGRPSRRSGKVAIYFFVRRVAIMTVSS